MLLQAGQDLKVMKLGEGGRYKGCSAPYNARGKDNLIVGVAT